MATRLNSRQFKTLQAIYSTPVPANIPWADIESLFRALGATIEKRSGGSRVAVELEGRDAHFHSPHPEKGTDRGAVKGVRDFLEQVGVKP